MSEQALIFELPIMQRYAIPYDVIKQHKWLSLKAQGTKWNELSADAFSESNLRLWLKSEITMEEFQLMIEDETVLVVGISTQATLNDYIQIANLPIQDVSII